MSMDFEQAYFERRERENLLAAQTAPTEAIAARHAELARRYGMLSGRAQRQARAMDPDTWIASGQFGSLSPPASFLSPSDLVRAGFRGGNGPGVVVSGPRVTHAGVKLLSNGATAEA